MEWNVPKFPLDAISDDVLGWLTDHGSWLTRAVSRNISDWIDSFTTALVSLPPWICIGIATLVSYRIGGRKIGVLTLAGLLFLWNLRLWQSTVETLVLVTLATVVALVIGIPVGICCALSRRAWRLFSPLLDMMQTLPSFVYLIPALPFFGLGAVSACFATIVFSVPPVIRLTALGIRGVPTELVEASDAFGGSAAQKLFKVQLPLALPTIMAGVNQTMMLALSMVVIAAMIGAGGLGREVWQSIQRLEAGAGFEAGIGIVIVAVILDRVTQALAARARPHGTA
ncbi:ABC transporter permease [Methylobacterium nodulans]|uniref:Binding-protein-dependent transport systems inner membrane component n=1 Tax=Methylobacterium nodulans (strain LMG 21967 / CNCM I-2342 / ORS 2060) TaxID=460265 RepID=B8IMD8_METNO|nr:proline/glycine betaine ABC transporter permease [Methylobacterium nodulans]ACL58324.1 binding-protein-dependent transport systems inner membrane component [Methylobacterium nodulans ORS 2060]